MQAVTSSLPNTGFVLCHGAQELKCSEYLALFTWTRELTWEKVRLWLGKMEESGLERRISRPVILSCGHSDCSSAGYRSDLTPQKCQCVVHCAVPSMGPVQLLSLVLTPVAVSQANNTSSSWYVSCVCVCGALLYQEYLSVDAKTPPRVVRNAVANTGEAGNLKPWPRYPLGTNAQKGE